MLREGAGVCAEKLPAGTGSTRPAASPGRNHRKTYTRRRRLPTSWTAISGTDASHAATDSMICYVVTLVGSGPALHDIERSFATAQRRCSD
eukprot:583970-Rhodomonas_salina.1